MGTLTPYCCKSGASPRKPSCLLELSAPPFLLPLGPMSHLCHTDITSCLCMRCSHSCPSLSNFGLHQDSSVLNYIQFYFYPVSFMCVFLLFSVIHNLRSKRSSPFSGLPSTMIHKCFLTDFLHLNLRVAK